MPNRSVPNPACTLSQGEHFSVGAVNPVPFVGPSGVPTVATTTRFQENQAAVRSISEAISAGNPSALDLVTEDNVEHNPAFPSDRRGPASLTAFVGPPLTAFSDFDSVEDDLIAEGDMVVCRHHATGTHGVPAHRYSNQRRADRDRP